MRIVIDTSVLVAAARSRQGASFALISRLPDPRFEIALSVALYTEWQAVLIKAKLAPCRERAAATRTDVSITILMVAPV
jgi:predicted nucleic acid-binding protein